ncbi:MAG: polysaccharide biosynthesis tyrosine autokinase [Pirellulales bacterium]
MPANPDNANLPLDADGADAGSSSDLVFTMFHWLRIARYRKNTIITTLCLATIAGAAYYALAPRYYASTAKLLIIQRSGDNLAMVSEQQTLDNTMATHQELVTSPVVIQAALEHLLPEHRVDLLNTPPQFWSEEIAKHLSATTTRKTNFIQVTYRSRSPEAAAGVVSAVVQSYLGFVDGTHKGTASEVLAGLTQELRSVERDIEVKQQELQQNRQRVGSLTIRKDDGIVHPTIQRALQLSEALTKAQEDRLNMERQHEAIQQAIASGGDLQPCLASLEETVGKQMMVSALGLSTEDLQLIRDNQQKLFDAQQELKSLSQFYGPAHPKIAELNERVRSTEAFLASYRTNSGNRMSSFGSQELGPLIESMLAQSVVQAKRKEEQLAKSFDAARNQAAQESGDVVRLESLEREVMRKERYKDTLVDRIGRIDLRQLQAPIQATVVREPLPDEIPVSPQLRNVLVLALFGGFGIGALIVYVQDVLDDRFTSPEEMMAQLSVPVLAMVRELQQLGGAGLSSLHTHVQPRAVEAEAFRTLRTALTLSAGDCNRILISSAEPGDGKTTVSANLAVSFAQAGKRTLVIDADLRKPGMTARFDLRKLPGVAEVLLADEPASEIAARLLRHTELANLDVLPAGARQPNPSELLSDPRFSELLAWAESCYDRVLVDCPPVLAVSDAQIVGRLVDGAILVVRPEKNHRRLVVRACESFAATGSAVLGIVANGLSSAANGRYGYAYGYGDGYGYGHDQESDESAEGAAEIAAENSFEEPITLRMSDIIDDADNEEPEHLEQRKAA